MFCNNCGEENPDGSKFCNSCGSQLQEIRKQLKNNAITKQVNTEAAEITLYSDDKGIRITNTRAIFRNKTYVMTNISSISLGEKAPNWIPAIFVLSFAVICLFINIPVGLFILIIGFIVVLFTKGEYSVRITSASGETDAFTSKDKEFIKNIVTAINEAIIKRG